jgi:hypothetical protein
MIRRRRPVLRAATMAGGAAIAYHAGKTSAANAGQGDAQPAEDAGVQQVAPAPPASVSTGGPSEEAIAKLKELGQLRDQGILTDQEFEAQKQKVLGG